MAVEIGVAANHVDLYNKLVTFLTSNSELVAQGRNWQVAWSAAQASYPYAPGHDTSGIVLKGPGNAALDEVFVGMFLTEDPNDDRYGMWFSANQGIIASNTQYNAHFNSVRAMHVPLFNQAMPYWFVANGRRFIVVAKISTTYVACYEGLFLPYATPDEYPYPMVSSGCAGSGRRWSDEYSAHTHFCMPQHGSPSSNYQPLSTHSTASTDGRMFVMNPAGVWTAFDNTRSGLRVFPWASSSGTTPDFHATQQTLIGGGHMLTPATLLAQHSHLRGTIGVLEGVFHVPGFGNAVENLITVGGVDHLVVQNMFRTGFTDYWALRLE